MKSPSIIELMTEPRLFGRDFGGPSWAAWRTLHRARSALPPEGGDLALFQQCTKRSRWPTTPAREVWAPIGRRGGKSRQLAAAAVYEACFVDHSAQLVAGERGRVLFVAPDRRQGSIVLDYVRAFLRHPLFAPLVEAERSESIDLRGGITIEVATASWRTIRGPTVLWAGLDESAFFWREETSANPDSEIVSALRPAMATVPGSWLFAVSSPHSRRGVLWTQHQRHYGVDDSPVLVWQADSRTMNPNLAQEVVDEAMRDDPIAAASEFGALFRSDLETFVDGDTVMRCVIPGRGELPRVAGVEYRAFCDPSGGSHDSMCLAIAHREGEGESSRVVLDAIREVRAPFQPDDVVREFAQLAKSYGIHELVGDRYGGAWPAERFRVHGITYTPASLAKSQLYTEMFPLLNAGRVELLDHARLVGQLVALERRTGRGTRRDVVDHPVGGRDDVANVLAGVVHQLAEHAAPFRFGFGAAEFCGLVDDPGAEERARVQTSVERMRERLAAGGGSWIPGRDR